MRFRILATLVLLCAFTASTWADELATVADYPVYDGAAAARERARLDNQPCVLLINSNIGIL